MTRKGDKRSRRRGGKAGKKSRTQKKGQRKPKIKYVYINGENPAEQKALPQPDQPRPGVFTWGDAGKLLAVNVGAILAEKGISAGIEEMSE